ncbi:unnamed protein product [Timema podura]|uniref:Pyruvate phosphate dikinase AMP/ATP-binding domain-containing protein n=1 Tax=Timema podura TaxID=61482 RepID=A0ABN7NUL4_TIMPD|nr:unnamed protein product [Timema podura]
MIDNLAPSLDMIVHRQNKDSVLSIPMRRCLRLYHRYEDDCPVAVPKPASLLLEPLITDYPLAVSFTDRECQSSDIVGGKGSSLALLSTLQHQVLVPPGLCLTVAAFQTQLEECSQLQKEITTLEKIVQGKLSGDLKQQCEKTVSLFGLTPVCGSVEAALVTLLGTLDTSTSFAVRSSAVGEDSEDLSAAGQNATFLGVQRHEEVLQAIQKCWGSLFTFQSVQYRRAIMTQNEFATDSIETLDFASKVIMADHFAKAKSMRAQIFS